MQSDRRNGDVTPTAFADKPIEAEPYKESIDALCGVMCKSEVLDGNNGSAAMSRNSLEHALHTVMPLPRIYIGSGSGVISRIFAQVYYHVKGITSQTYCQRGGLTTFTENVQ